MNLSDHDMDRRLLSYAGRIVKLVDCLPSTRAGIHVAGQLLRAGTAPLSIYGARGAAESREDLVRMLRSCWKDLQESRRWLQFVKHLSLLHPASELELLVTEAESLIGIFAASIWTARSKSELRWRLRRPSPRSPRPARSRVWGMAKRAVRRLCVL
jgi:four helix bundle protein